jgi:hypothetical protein
MSSESEEVLLTAEQVAEFSAPFPESFRYSNRRSIMTTALAKKPASLMRTYTQQVRDHAAAMARAQDQYFAALKRAENQYFEAATRITEAMTQATKPVDPRPEEAEASPLTQ